MTPRTASILEGWTVRNMMRRDVVTVPGTMSVSQLANLLQEHGITGAPVVDADENVLGVVSQSDIVRALSRTTSAAGGDDVEASSSFFTRTDGDPFPGWSSVALSSEDPIGSQTVAEIMMPVRFSVRPETSLAGLARYLVSAGVHRALVMEEGALLGIVTTFDVLHALANSEVTEEE